MTHANFPAVSFDKMLDMPQGTVIEQLPASERNRYCLRATSLGSLGINLAHRLNRLNIRNDLTMYLVVPEANETNNENNYRTVLMQARAMAWHGLPQQFNAAERAELSRLVGRPVEHAPSIILGMDPNRLRIVHEGMGGQPIVAHEVPFAAVDPYSREALSDIFGVDVATLPLTPGALGPDFPPPALPSMGGF